MTDESPARVLVINSGSSSVKFALFESSASTPLAAGVADRIGTEEASLICTFAGEKTTDRIPAGDIKSALHAILGCLESCLGSPLRLTAIGHRVVHGGEFFRAATRIDADVLEKIEACSKLAPLHNPAHAAGIRTAGECFPGVPQVAVFDTAFHQSMPEHAFLYAVPYEYYETLSVRRYGMHGTSHHYVSLRAAEVLGMAPDAACLITAHLGNGCSVCAVRDGRSVDTTMGLTPLEGVMMGTRSGDVDPNLHGFLAENAGLSLSEITNILNRQSGLLGVSGVSNDMRTVANAAESGNARAALAIRMFSYRLAKGILAMAAGLPRLDALVFTGGIGENSAAVREQTVADLGVLRLQLDAERNATSGRTSDGIISPDDPDRPRVMIVPTNEEWMIAKSTMDLVTANL